ncbi:hypothetical protein AAC387_Pa07g2023 [Persea americana]
MKKRGRWVLREIWNGGEDQEGRWRRAQKRWRVMMGLLPETMGWDMEDDDGVLCQGDGVGEPGVCVQIWERFCVSFFWIGLGVLKLRGIRPGLGER